MLAILRKNNNLAKLAGIYSGIIFGLYWIILRKLETQGFSGLWSVMLFNLVPACLLLPVLLHRRKVFFPGRARFHLSCLIIGLGYVSYAASFVYTEVVNAIALFYLLPIWGFLVARIFIGEKITPIRWFCMGCGLLGIIILFGKESGLPVPTNSGDYMALFAGIFWAIGSLLLLTDENDTLSYSIGFIFWATLLSLVFAYIASRSGHLDYPSLDQIDDILIWLLPVAVIVLVPAAIATIYAPTNLNPGTTGLLFMTEISVATGTAAWLAGEPFGINQLLGVIFITLAGLSEPVYDLLKKK